MSSRSSILSLVNSDYVFGTCYHVTTYVQAYGTFCIYLFFGFMFRFRLVGSMIRVIPPVRKRSLVEVNQVIQALSSLYEY